jgi:hypothetical protein
MNDQRIRASQPPLHSLTVPTDGDPQWKTGDITRPCHVVGREGVPVVAMFDDLPGQCCKFIEGADTILGCVAWLTNARVLAALSQVPSVSIIVQKEDFLRPDSGRQYKAQLRALYQRLHSIGLGRLTLGGTSSYSTASEHPGDDCAIRCMGIVSRGQKIAVPRMHHKFLVRCEARYCLGQDCTQVDGAACHCCKCQDIICHGHPEPAAVWTGSFNMTHNGANSLENAVVIADPAIAQRYQYEWGWIFGLSEPLNWEHDWVEPEMRLGS